MRGSNKQMNVPPFKDYTIDLFQQELSKLHFPNYQNYNDISKAYNDFIQKIIKIIDQIAPIKERRVKQNFKQWFDREIANEIKNRDRLYKKFKTSNIYIDKYIHMYIYIYIYIYLEIMIYIMI